MNGLITLLVAAGVSIAVNIVYFLATDHWLGGAAQWGILLLFSVAALAIVVDRMFAASASKRPAKKTGPGNKPGTAKPQAKGAGLEQGTVKWFDGRKGFGFITRENGEEIFVHFRSVQRSGGKGPALRDGDAVQFRVVESKKGPQAEEVSRAS